MTLSTLHLKIHHPYYRSNLVWRSPVVLRGSHDHDLIVPIIMITMIRSSSSPLSYLDIVGITWSECLRGCCENPRCKSFDFVSSTKKCNLHYVTKVSFLFNWKLSGIGYLWLRKLFDQDEVADSEWKELPEEDGEVCSEGHQHSEKGEELKRQ